MAGIVRKQKQCATKNIGVRAVRIMNGNAARADVKITAETYIKFIHIIEWRACGLSVPLVWDIFRLTEQRITNGWKDSKQLYC